MRHSGFRSVYASFSSCNLSHSTTYPISIPRCLPLSLMELWLQIECIAWNLHLHGLSIRIHGDVLQELRLAESHVEEHADLLDWSAGLVPEGVLTETAVGALESLISLVAVSAGETPVTTVGPGQLGGEPSECVVDGPGDDEVVVDDNQETDHQHPVAQSLGDGGHPPKDLERSLPSPLAQRELQEEEREARHHQHGQVGDEERDSWQDSFSLNHRIE